MEELQKVLQERGLTVSTHPEKGRCLLTTKDFSPGDAILRLEPYVCVPNNSAEPRCDGCFTSGNLKKCSACQVVWYCGSSCQKLEWKLHRLECSVLAKLDKDKRRCVTPSVRLMVKLYIKRKLQSDKIIPATSIDNYNLVEELMSHMEDLDEKQLVLYAQMANLVNLIFQWSDINIKEIAENFCKLACNAHTICDSELRPMGTGLYLIVSIINHSCLPNALLVFEGRSAVVRAVQNIPKGDEFLIIEPWKSSCHSGVEFRNTGSLCLSPQVSITYIETAGSTVTRQKALKEQYFFSCTCPRCIKAGHPEDIEESAILEGYRCKDDRCNGFLMRDSDERGFMCQQCGLLRTKEELKKIASEIRAVSDKALKSTSSDTNQEAISTYKMIEKLQRRLCHPFSINLIQTREKLIKLLMEVEDWRGTLSYCRLTIPAYQRVYPEFHPLLGLQYYTCGKLEWLLGDTEDAIKSLTRAVDILRITHGTNTPFMKELVMKLEEARAEASYKPLQDEQLILNSDSF